MTVEFDEYGEGGCCDIKLAPDAVDFLAKAGKDASKRRKAKALLRILTKIRERGVNGVANTEQLRHEGRYSLGQPGLGDVPIYAVKANPLRLYGGVVSERGRAAFVVTVGTVKKTRKANRSLLEAAARKLGEQYVKTR